MYNNYNKVRCLKRIVRDNDIGKGLGMVNKWNGNGVRMIALKSIAEIGGDEAIKSLKRIKQDSHINGELKINALKLLKTLVCDRENKKLDKAVSSWKL